MDIPVPCELAGVSRRFGRTLAVDRVDFRVRRGEVVALLGPNGAGKTTLVRMLLGLIRPSGGTVKLWGLTNTAGHLMALALWSVVGLAAATWAYRCDEGKQYG
jgi:ABC-type multidrug transport system ATPase subunit